MKMKMRNKRTATKLITTLTMLLVLSIFIVNCSEMERDLLLGRRMAAEMAADGAELDNETIHQEIQAPVASEGSEAPVLSELEMRIAHYEALVQTAGTVENFMQLASLYREAGMIRNLRDTLERTYRQNSNREAFDQLQSIVVNTLEEGWIVQEKMWELREALRIESNQSDAIEIVTSDVRFAVM
jgi:hypothetical protein